VPQPAPPRPAHAAGRLARAAAPDIGRRPALGRGPGPGRRGARGRGAAVTFRGQFRVPEATGLAGLFLRVTKPSNLHGPFTAQAALADPANHIVTLGGPGDWTTHGVTAPIPDDANTVVFGVFLAGPGRIELRNPELTRAGLAY
jgi:hypothetical protein